MSYREMNEIETKYANAVVSMLRERKLISKSDMYCKDIAKDESDDGIAVFLDKKSAYALPSKDDKGVARIVFNGMYEHSIPADNKYTYDDSPRFTIETLEALAEIFGSRKINIGDVNGGGGCESCGYGGQYTLEVFVHDVTV